MNIVEFQFESLEIAQRVQACSIDRRLTVGVLVNSARQSTNLNEAVG